MNSRLYCRSMSFIMAAGILLAWSTQLVWAGVVVSVTPYSSNWQSTYNSFGVQENFGSTTLNPGLSITLQGGVFPSSQTYSSLPQLFDPTKVAGGDFDGPFLNNTWGSTYMVTNFGYDASKPSGQNWINSWGPGISDEASQITFNFSQGVTSVGIGLSNFQSTNPAAPDFPITNHLLLINSVALSEDLETLAGANWSPGIDVRNGYLIVTATAGTVIHSLGFEDINPSPSGFDDGLNFGALGYTAAAIPEPNSLILLGAGVLGILGYNQRNFKRRLKPRPQVAVVDL
jgi:PEP-CTERM motif